MPDSRSNTEVKTKSFCWSFLCVFFVVCFFLPLKCASRIASTLQDGLPMCVVTLMQDLLSSSHKKHTMHRGLYRNVLELCCQFSVNNLTGQHRSHSSLPRPNTVRMVSNTICKSAAVTCAQL